MGIAHRFPFQSPPALYCFLQAALCLNRSTAELDKLDLIGDSEPLVAGASTPPKPQPSDPMDKASVAHAAFLHRLGRERAAREALLEERKQLAAERERC